MAGTAMLQATGVLQYQSSAIWALINLCRSCCLNSIYRLGRLIWVHVRACGSESRYVTPWNSSSINTSIRTRNFLTPTKGYHVCEYKAAAAAGAVFGVLVWFMKLPLAIYMEAKEKNKEGSSQTVSTGYSHQMDRWGSGF